MNRPGRLHAALLGLLWLVACDGEQYVSPDTVALSITKDASGVERVNRCNYVPVLLGDKVDATYAVEGELQVNLSITRDSYRVAFEGAAVAVDPFVVTATELKAGPQTDPTPPPGYTVKLSLGCTPDP
jgi:hypothetical protein